MSPRSSYAAASPEGGLLAYTGPYGGRPLSRQGGQLTNYGAQQLNTASRNYLGQNYMPRTTVGGSYGLGGGPLPGSADYEADVARRIGIARQGNFRESRLGDLNRRGVGLIRPINSYGATSGTVIDSTGRPRPGWIDDYSGSTGAVGPEDTQRGLAAVYNQGGRVISPSGRMSLSPGTEQYDATQRAGEVFDARRGGLAARVADYEARTAEAAQFRQGNRIARGLQRGQRMTDTMDLNRGLLSLGERFAFANPEPYARMAEAQGLLGVQREGLQSRERMAGQGLASQENIARLQGEQRMGLAELAGAQAEKQLGLQLAGQKDIEGVRGANAMGLAGVQVGGQKDIAGIQGQSGLAIAKQNAAVEEKRAQIAGLAALHKMHTDAGDMEGAARIAEQMAQLYGGSPQSGPGNGGILDFVGASESGLATPAPTRNMTPVAAARGLEAAGNTSLNERLNALGQGLLAIPRDAMPLQTYEPLHALSNQLQEMEAQGHITKANRRQVAAKLKAQMPKSVMGALGQVDDQRLGILDPIGSQRTHATYLRNFFGMAHPSAPAYGSPYGHLSTGIY